MPSLVTVTNFIIIPDHRQGESIHGHIGYRKLKELSEKTDSNLLVMDVLKVREALTRLMEDKNNHDKDDWIYCVLLIFATCSQTNMKWNKTIIFSILSETNYLYSLHKKLLFWSLRERKENAKTAEHLVIIAYEFMNTCPDAAMDIPLDNIKSFVAEIDGKKDLLTKVIYIFYVLIV